MAYENIPGVRGSYTDGSLRSPNGSTQPKLLVLGSGTSGISNELYNANSVRAAEAEFGASTELLKGFHEMFAQEADNISLMRVGGTQGSFVFTDSAGATLTIVPSNRDNTVLSNYALIMDGSGTSNRIIVWDLVNEEFVYDSSELLVLDEGTVKVVDTGIDLFSVATLNDETTYKALSALATGDFNVEGTATAASVLATQGTDGQLVSLVEKYAALNTAYHNLDYQDADMIAPQGVYIDDANVTDSGATANFFKGVPPAGAITDELGYVWQYIHRGKLYTYFLDSATYFTDLSGAVAATVTVNTDLVMTASKVGAGGNNFSIQINAAGASGPTVTVSEPDAESLKVLVTDDGSATTSAAVTAINTALGLYTTNTGVLASTLLVASGGAATTLTTVAETDLASGDGGAVLTHAQLTGDAVPSAVTAAFAAANDNQVRECNFAHQLATFCHLASTTWKTIIGAISFRAPTSLDRVSVADWVGDHARYVVGPNGSQKIVDATADNGSGILGHKLLAGAAASGGGYRNAAIVDAASSVDGLAYGGLIKTKGLSLPNADDFPDHSYGIDDTDELLDINRKPVDLGKHILVTYDWPIHRNSFNGGTSYRGPTSNALLGKLAIMPEKEEPIGPNGLIQKVTAPPRVHATQKDKLAGMRVAGLTREPNVGYIFVSTKTAAHPDSDYTRVSTIRSVNRALQGCRNIGKKYLGKEFSAQKLIALQSALEVFLNDEKKAGYNNGTKVGITFTKAQKILGILKIKLKMVPPFSIESIDVEISLAADESEL